jgi:hypothetical protein
MTEQAPGQHLAETFLSTSNTHDPGLLDRSVAEDYRDHNACATDRPGGEPSVLDCVLRRHPGSQRQLGRSGGRRDRRR